jgi:hypothetical protein
METLKTNPFEFVKNVKEDEEIFKFSAEEYNKFLDEKPWKKKFVTSLKNYFKSK